MTSVGKRFALNLSRGKSTKKKSNETRDELDIEHSAYVAYRKSSIGQLQPGSGMPQKSGKSNSLSNVNADMDAPLDQEDIVALTQDVRSFSDTLATLKCVFSNEEATEDPHDGDLKVAAHKELGEVLGILRGILQKYPSLHTTDVLTTAAVLITKIKSFNYEEMTLDVSDVLYSIDQLALAFSSSVTEFLMGDADGFSNIHKAKSFDNLVGQDAEGQSTEEESKENVSMTGEDCELILMKLDSGVDLALQRAKVWSKYAKDIISYIDKRASLEMEFSKNLSKLAANVRPVITEDVYLPFQSVYCTALDHDLEYAETCQTSCALIQTQKFIEPLNQVRIEHDKTRKSIKENWTRELRKMQEAVANLRKARSSYIQRQQEYEKARSQKAEVETQGQSSGTISAKAEKKKKLEEDAMLRAMEAESTYKAYVMDANKRQEELTKVKADVLTQIRDLVVQCESTMKVATVAYFQLQHTVTAPLPVQYQSLCESSQHYEPGTQYSEHIKQLQVPPRSTSQEKFTFEAYAPEKSYGERKPSTQSSGSGSSDVLGDDSPSPHRSSHDVGLKTAKLWGHHAAGSDTDSISESSYKSRESSPSASPYNHRSGRLRTSSSMNELAEADRDAANYDNRLRNAMGEVSDLPSGHAFRGVNFSPAARTHSFRKLRAPSRCRECDSYVYFQGAECSTCQLTSHKRCLESLHFECGGKFVAERRMTTFGVAFSEHVQETHTEIPHLVTKCTAEIDKRGLECKGIYRMSGVKSKVEKLCQSFENDEWNVDLSEHPPNVIANVLKLYLRQLPEPLLTFNLYPYLITLAKQEEEKTGDSSGMVEKLTHYMSQLPKANFRTCAHIMHHLQRVTKQAETNQMSASNLGIVFGPTLLRPSEGTASLNSLIETPYQTRIIEQLISNAKSIFGPEESSQESQDPSESKKKDEEVVEGSSASQNAVATGEVNASSQPGAASESRDQGKDGSSSEQSESKWYIPPITGDMLAELVQAEPRFQQCTDEFITLPGSTETDARGESSTDDTLTANPDAESDVDGDDLPEALLPDGSHTQSLAIPATAPMLNMTDFSRETVSPDSSRAHDATTSGNKSSLCMSGVSQNIAVENEATCNSPGLRRKLLASEVLSRGGSTFYTHQESHSLTLPNSSRKVLLSKPKHYSPPLQKRTMPEKSSQSTFYVPNVTLTKDDSVLDQESTGHSKLSAQRSQSLPHSQDVLQNKTDNSARGSDSATVTKKLKPRTADASAVSDSKQKSAKDSVYV